MSSLLVGDIRKSSGESFLYIFFKDKNVNVYWQRATLITNLVGKDNLVSLRNDSQKISKCLVHLNLLQPLSFLQSSV